MLVAGGKTSTITQFTELARQAGLGITAARTQSSGRYVVECRPQRQGTRMTQEDAEAVFGWQTEHPYQDFESPGLIGQWVPGRPRAR
jgi:hypothetical protein